MDGAVGVVVSARTTPLAVFVDVFHQQPRAIAACVINTSIRNALMHHQPVVVLAAHGDFDGLTHFVAAKQRAALIPQSSNPIHTNVCLLDLTCFTVYSDIHLGDAFRHPPNSDICTHIDYPLFSLKLQSSISLQSPVSEHSPPSKYSLRLFASQEATCHHTELQK